jgi:hypothetical protein
MLKTKKAGFGLPIVALHSLAIIALIIIFFSLYFFVLGGAKSQEMVIKGEEFPAIKKLPNILSATMSETETIKDLVADVYLGNKNQEELVKILDPILSNLTIKPIPKGATVGWNFKVYTKEKEPIEKLSVYTSPVVSASSGAQYYNEYLLLPIPEQKPILIELYLFCLSCNEEYLRSYA